jgi:TonB family protein
VNAPTAKQLEVDIEPKLVSKPQPKYTEQALSNKIQGPIRMWLLVDSEGRVEAVEIILGLPDGLNEEAMRAAYNLKFKPALKDGRRVEYWLLFETNQSLDRSARIETRMNASVRRAPGQLGR